MKVAIIGAGWAGCAAAVEATWLGHHATVFEAARTAGGRARRLDVEVNGQTIALDNGQHILIGAYSQTLRLMADMGVNIPQTLHRMPLTLQFPNGNGLKLPSLPAPLDALVGIALARGWSWGDKLSLLTTAAQWHINKFQCAPHQSVADLCSNISLRVMASLIEPLCVSALNTPTDRASGQVFLRVLKDSLFAPEGGSNLLLPKADLSALLPDAALAWVTGNGGHVQLGCRVNSISPQEKCWHPTDATGAGLGEFDSVILACPPLEAARLARSTAEPCTAWLDSAEGLQYEAIATVYAHAPDAHLAQPMLALPSSSQQPAQFVFDRGQLGGPAGLLAFVVSASQQSSAELAVQVTAQAADQLGLHHMQVLQTVVDKRATFACTPGLQRPVAQVAPGLLACGDYIDGPYPATLEGAVRSGLQAAALLERR
jgi:squalene-associated FAD-dependent desaturase